MLRIVAFLYLFVFGSCGVVTVTNNLELTNAIAAATAGTVIELDNGTYEFDQGRIDLAADGTADARIVLRAKYYLMAVIDLGDNSGSVVTEGFVVMGRYWTVEGIVFRGSCSSVNNCEHALHIVANGDYALVRHNVFMDFNAAIKGNGIGSSFPGHIEIRMNQFGNTNIRSTGNPVTPVDVVGGERWVVADNFFHDIAKAGGVSYVAFLKGGGENGIFERNVVACEWKITNQGEFRIGLSFGGGGTTLSEVIHPEHTNGIMRNNVIIDCQTSDSHSIFMNECVDCAIIGNTIYGPDTSQSIVLRGDFDSYNTEVSSNHLVCTGSCYSIRDDMTITESNNVKQSIDEFEDVLDQLKQLEAVPVSSSATEVIIGQGANPNSFSPYLDTDFFCVERASPSTAGAFEFPLTAEPSSLVPWAVDLTVPIVTSGVYPSLKSCSDDNSGNGGKGGSTSLAATLEPSLF